MQKIILASLLLFILFGQTAYAESSSEIGNIPDNQNKSNIQQDEFTKIMQDNISFEKEKRQLVNEVALEKLRSELKKLRGTATSPAIPTMTENSTVRPEASHPYVILVSKIGGLTRILVSDGGNKYYLSAGERFSSGGKSYVLNMNSAGKYYVKEYQ
ncbi:hypothetical protein YT03_000337 [Salmonella enterica subsp. enterica]|nr:hypothetical protein [Salmonella enterica subsp. enterica serovar Sandiego]